MISCHLADNVDHCVRQLTREDPSPYQMRLLLLIIIIFVLISSSTHLVNICINTSIVNILTHRKRF